MFAEVDRLKGEYTIEVWNKRVRYALKIRRNITVITGDSGTGKTTLVKMIDAYDNNGVSSGVHLKCNVRCTYLHGRNWRDDLDKINNSIVFIDEQSSFIIKKEFAVAIQGTDNYYVLITRYNLEALPYSVHEIYGLRAVRNSGLHNSLLQTYNEQYELYGNHVTQSGVEPDCIITEDSNSGYQFFSNLGSRQIKKCISACGKTNIKNMIDTNLGGKVLIVADGAAFGCEMRDTILKIKEHPNYYLWLPESFEWVLLKSNILRFNVALLNEPYNYIESSEYFSWERYFTDLLIKVCEKTPGKIQYTKSKLPGIFLSNHAVTKVFNTFPAIKIQKEA